MERLRVQGITAGGTQKNLQQLCVRNNIPMEEVIPKVQLGWEGKQKGLLQVLWERGWIDTSKINECTIDGTKDLLGVRQKETSLKSFDE